MVDTDKRGRLSVVRAESEQPWIRANGALLSGQCSLFHSGAFDPVFSPSLGKHAGLHSLIHGIGTNYLHTLAFFEFPLVHAGIKFACGG